MSVRPEPAVSNELLYRSALFGIGRFAAPASAPGFATAGEIVAPVVVFPRRSVWIRHAGGEAFVADAHTATLYNVGQHYRRAAISGDGDVSDWFRVSAPVLAEVLGAAGERAEDPDAPFTRPWVAASTRVSLAERALFARIRASAPGDSLEVDETALALLANLLGGARRGSPTASRRRQEAHAAVVQAARAALGAAVTRHTSLSELAARVGCSPFHLCRVFRREAGTTLYGYRDRLRLFAALEHILDRQADLTEAALHAGYSSHSHFTWAFRRTFALTPSAVRSLTMANRRTLRDAVHRLLAATDRRSRGPRRAR